MEENKEVVEETTQPKEEGKLKIKMPKIVKDDGPIKLDLSKKEEPVEQVKENETTNDSADETRVLEDVKSEDTGASQEQKEVQPEAEAQEAPVLEEVTEQKVEEKVEELVEETKEAIAEAKETGEPLKEYYKQTKSHLNNEEIDFLIEDRFSYDEEEATDREIKRKKLAFKEQVADARRHMDGLKSSYYEEIKAGSKLTSDQKEAINFYNEYNKNSEQNKKVQLQQKSVFDKKTESLFNNEFKGFEYNVGEKTYRFNVNNASEVKQTQSDINNFVKKFLNEKNEMSDAKGYHKSLFTAMNSDAIAQHFYEQGKADAIKESVSKAKNVDMSPRQSYGDEKTGFKYKVLGDNSSSFKLKLKK